MELIDGAVYSHGNSGERVLYLGGRINSAVLEGSDGRFELSWNSFLEFYELTDIHNHEDYCCSVHGLHVSPHRGCLLR